MKRPWFKQARQLANDLRFFPRIVAKLNFNISCILGQRLAERVESGAAE